MLAETRRGECVRSWIWQPAHRLLYVSERGGGVLRNGEPMAALGPRERPWRAAVYARLRRRPELPAGWRLTSTLGSCAIDYPGVAEGRVDALAYRSLHPWDHLPGALLLEELGGFVGVSGGRPWRAGVAGGILFAAASREVFDEADAALSGAG
jgi:fructose-1,6-bisphosphatase/inositol monophosphatase family enzyme